MIDDIWFERDEINVLLFVESVVLVHGRSIEISESVVRRYNSVD